MCKNHNVLKNAFPQRTFIFRWKNKPGVILTTGPHKPRHHYKIRAPKVRNAQPEALRGQDRVPRGEKTEPESAARALCGPGRAARARPFRSGLRPPVGRRRAELPPKPGDSRPTSPRPPAGLGRGRSRSRPATRLPLQWGLGPLPGRADAAVASGRPPLPHRRPTAAATRSVAPTPGRPPAAATDGARGAARGALTSRASSEARYSSRRPPHCPSGRTRLGPRRPTTAEAAEPRLTQGSGAQGRRNPPSSEAAAAAAASSGAAGGGDASPLPAAGSAGEGRRPLVRPRRRRQGPRRWLARSLARSLPPAPARRSLPRTLTRSDAHPARPQPRSPAP